MFRHNNWCGLMWHDVDSSSVDVNPFRCSLIQFPANGLGLYAVFRYHCCPSTFSMIVSPQIWADIVIGCFGHALNQTPMSVCHSINVKVEHVFSCSFAIFVYLRFICFMILCDWYLFFDVICLSLTNSINNSMDMSMNMDIQRQMDWTVLLGLVLETVLAQGMLRVRVVVQQVQ